VAGRTLSVLLRAGIAGAVCRGRLQVDVPAGAATFESYISGHLGVEVGISTHLRAQRANSKLVLQLVTAAGTTVGFAKIGTTQLSSDLVRAEAAALTRLDDARLATLSAPQVLHAGDWGSRPVLVMSALPTHRRRGPAVAEQTTAAMLEVARLAGVERGQLVDSAYWHTLINRLTSVEASGDRTALLAALDAVAAGHGEAVLSYGAWHGDWTSWNMASSRDGLLVWDWERFAVGPPLGFDALHYWLWSRIFPAGTIAVQRLRSASRTRS
jgi:hypothetical protein